MVHWQSTVLRAAAANRTSEDRRSTGLPRLRSAVADYAASACISGVNCATKTVFFQYSKYTYFGGRCGRCGRCGVSWHRCLTETLTRWQRTTCHRSIIRFIFCVKCSCFICAFVRTDDITKVPIPYFLWQSGRRDRWCTECSALLHVKWKYWTNVLVFCYFARNHVHKRSWNVLAAINLGTNLAKNVSRIVRLKITFKIIMLHKCSIHGEPIATRTSVQHFYFTFNHGFRVTSWDLCLICCRRRMKLHH